MARAISNDFLNEFINKDGKFYELLEIVKADNSLALELRGEYVEIYYRGGMLFQIDENNMKSVNTTPEYLNIDSSAFGSKLKTVCKENPDVEYALENMPFYKQAIDFHHGQQKATDEREFQQLIERSNNYISTAVGSDYYIVDIEYESVKKDVDLSARFDMLALLWPSQSRIRRKKNDIPLSIIEVKYGDKAMSGHCGIKEHILDYIKLRKNPEIVKEICDDMAAVFMQKHKMGLVPGYSGENADITVIGDKMDLIFVLGDHDPDSTILLSELTSAIEELEGSDDKKYLDNIFIATGSFMGYGLFAYKGNRRRFTSIRDYVILES